MNICIIWQKPILLAKRKKICFDQKHLSKLEKRPGVYFFSRRYAGSYLPFYVGETFNIRGRLKQHLASKKIADVLRGISDRDLPSIRQGERYFHAGYFKGKPGQDPKKCLDIVQRQLIEQAVAEELPLLNHQLTRVATHTLTFTGSKNGRSIFPKRKQIKA